MLFCLRIFWLPTHCAEIDIEHSMKIYFCGSIRGGREDVAIYKELISMLSEYGNVLTGKVSKTRRKNGSEEKRTTLIAQNMSPTNN